MPYWSVQGQLKFSDPPQGFPGHCYTFEGFSQMMRDYGFQGDMQYEYGRWMAQHPECQPAQWAYEPSTGVPPAETNEGDLTWWTDFVEDVRDLYGTVSDAVIQWIASITGYMPYLEGTTVRWEKVTSLPGEVTGELDNLSEYIQTKRGTRYPRAFDRIQREAERYERRLLFRRKRRRF